jgi:hypothetical protein
MQSLKILLHWFDKYANSSRYLFVAKDIQALFPDMRQGALKALLSRAVAAGYIMRVCRGLYAYKPEKFSRGLLLFHAAAYLRAGDFNYISLETALSDMGVISQIPMNYISIMSSGRSNQIDCGKFGRIDFVHTDQKPADLVDQLVYDPKCRMWRAHVGLAIRDMKKTRRTTINLVDWSVVDEFI